MGLHKTNDSTKTMTTATKDPAKLSPVKVVPTLKKWVSLGKTPANLKRQSSSAFTKLVVPTPVLSRRSSLESVLTTLATLQEPIEEFPLDAIPQDCFDLPDVIDPLTLTELQEPVEEFPLGSIPGMPSSSSSNMLVGWTATWVE